MHVGSFTNDFITFAQRDLQRMPKYNATGCSQTLLSNRLSWFFNLRGTSLTLDTACSSGLVALDLACRELWSGCADMVSSHTCLRLMWPLLPLHDFSDIIGHHLTLLRLSQPAQA